MSYSPVVPLAALGAAGAAAVSLVGSGYAQNCFAKKIHKEIPADAKPYPNYLQRNRDHVFTNNSRIGWVAGFMAFGAVFVGARIAMQPVFNAVRRKYIFIPGTNTPRRITSLAGLGYDLAPDLMVWVAPVAPAVPVGMMVKVCVDGPGRFKNWNESYNPYDKFVASQKQLFHRPEEPVRSFPASAHY